MTCIAVCKLKSGKIVMAGDRRLTHDWSMATEMPVPKIRKTDEGYLVGAAGTGNLATVLVELTAFPEAKSSDLSIYMHFQFKKSLIKSLIASGYGNSDGTLMIPGDDGMHGIVVIHGHVFAVDVRHPDDSAHHGNVLTGIVEIEEMGTPYAVGCGSSTATPILRYLKRQKGYSTKEDLRTAMFEAADLSPGCDFKVDIISE